MSKPTVVCMHPEHACIFEIMTRDELEKVMKYDEKYEILFSCDSREAALLFVQNAVSDLLEKDPGLSSMKKDLRESYGKA